MTLADPCSPPKSLVPPTLIDQQYTLTSSNAPSYTIGDFIVEPAYCDISVEYSISPLVSVKEGAPSSAITQTDKVFDFFYNYELEDLTQKQTVKVTATSGTLTEQASFDLTFKDPCTISGSLVSITPVLQANPLPSPHIYDG